MTRATLTDDGMALEVAVDAARAAGDVAMRYYRGNVEVRLKADLTPVTQADREAEQRIVGVIRRAFPGHGFLGEEFGAQGNDAVRWLIDPIDGTKNFVRRIPVWATLIALEERGSLMVGVIYNPVTGDLITARRGAGAFLNGRRLSVSRETELSRALLVHADLKPLRATPRWDGFLRCVDATGRQRGFGDYMGYALVAEGKAEIYVEVDLKPWDLAPCRLAVEEAGGRFTDLDGEATIYSGSALATNGALHDQVLALLKG